jgi:aryl-alcohol dehydrogenase-like predicted oxidoreductase
VEQELVPMALEFGLGITPWSPLKSGTLTGKYSRKNAGQVKSDRGFLVDRALGEKTYQVIELLESIAQAYDATPARIALAWVQSRAGVASTIIGARRVAQLEDNIKALDVHLSADERTRLDELTNPSLGFPQSMLPAFPAIHHGGATVNGVHAPTSPFVIGAGESPY